MNFLILILLSLFIASCESQKSKKSDLLSVQEKMQGLGNEFAKLLPIVHSQVDFESAEKRPEIIQYLKNLNQLSHSISQKDIKPYIGEEPLALHSLKELNQDFQSALMAFERGNKSYSRGLIKQSMSYCIRCHTRFASRNFLKLDWSEEWVQRLNPMEKAELQASTRNFAEALALYSKIYTSTSSPIIDKETALKRYMDISLRANRNPEGFLEWIQKNPLPTSLDSDLSPVLDTWKKDLQSWVKDRNKAQPLTFAKRLVKQAQIRQTYELDPVSHILFYRASNVFHDLLRREKTKYTKADIFYQLGKIYNVLSAGVDESLPELYFKSCILQYPASKLARSCYFAYERRQYLNFSGSRGLSLPSEVKRKLKKLKGLAGS